VTDLRFVIDERSFDMRSIEEEMVAASLEALADLLFELRERGRSIGLVAGWGNLSCRPDADLADVLNSEGIVDRDIRRSLLGLLGKCVAWDTGFAGWLDPSTLINGDTWESFGVACAHRSVSLGHGHAVLTMPHTGHRGALTVRAANSAQFVHFLAYADDEQLFYRSLFELESVPESNFFELAADAFPRLCFSANLDFRKFKGDYLDLRAVVVHSLSALNDLWDEAYKNECGDSVRVSARLGIEVSIEGNTRSSEKLMRLRDVQHQGRTYRCEWHAKLAPDRNRIHFHPGDKHTAGRVFVGIFVDHLPT
jgi:hypothetical protein